MSPPGLARAVLVAAGASTRMGAGASRKPFLGLDGRSVLEVACEALERAPSVAEIVVVSHPDDVARVEDWSNAARESGTATKIEAIVPGGAERADSVRLGARAETQRSIDLICVHDAARPLVTPDAIERVIGVAARTGAALLALPARDTLKHSVDGRRVERTLDRDGIWAAQTPQVFDAGRFLELLEKAEREEFRPTDDAALWERYVGAVTIVEGEPTNEKITRPADLEIARAILRSRAESEPPGGEPA